jgi:3-isopropylmalate/(R)-2-methylmalate dehydratase small subunit
VECPALADEAQPGDEVEVNLEAGTARNRTQGKDYTFPPLAGPAAELVAAGGLVPLVKARLARR